MIRNIELYLSLEEATVDATIQKAAAAFLAIDEEQINGVRVRKRSIDARSSSIKAHLHCDVFIQEEMPPLEHFMPVLKDVSKAMRVLVVGAGPAGLFAALKLIELGLKPIVIERGKDVRARRHDLAAINKKHTVNPESNYCFGEGGAGTYSDGKLYTRATKRGDVERILNIFVAHGANADITVEAHPHIGTNKLPKIIEAMRHTILNAGGEICFDTKLVGFLKKGTRIHGCKAVAVDNPELLGDIDAKAVILATGHSARDVFQLLHQEGIRIEAKPFALGLRIEHPQELIDTIRYRCETRPSLLPPASYALTHQVDGRGVYSFCMCPGGFIVPAATAPGELVVNGMSPSRRNSRFANSGMVVSVEHEDVVAFQKEGPLAFLAFQQMVEQRACAAGGSTQVAPAQRMTDFVAGRISSSLPQTSYQPGLQPAALDEVLPAFIATRLKEGFKVFGKKMKGYLTEDALLVGVESRTSSPVRIPRDKEQLMHPDWQGLFPCGEGAGYAGGIVSAAMDGERCAEKCFEYIRSLN